MKIYKVREWHDYGYPYDGADEMWYFLSLEKAKEKLEEILQDNKKEIQEVFYGGNFIKAYESIFGEVLYSLEEINIEE